MKQSSYDGHRSNRSIYSTITASLPIIEVDLDLNPQQMTMLMKGFKYVLPCQYRFSRKSTDEIIAEQYRHLLATIKSCLNDYRIPTNDERSKRAFQALQQLVCESYSKSISKKLTIRAKQEKRIVRSIQQLLSQRPDIIIRRTDKSKVFYIGKAIDFERKAQDYMLKTSAYEEIRDGRCPLANHLQAVQTLLNQSVSRNNLTIQLRNKLLPNLHTLELGHYHGLPKPHKVFLFKFIFTSRFDCFHCFYLAGNTFTAHYCFYEWTFNTDLKIFK